MLKILALMGLEKFGPSSYNHPNATLCAGASLRASWSFEAPALMSLKKSAITDSLYLGNEFTRG